MINNTFELTVDHEKFINDEAFKKCFELAHLDKGFNDSKLTEEHLISITFNDERLVSNMPLVVGSGSLCYGNQYSSLDLPINHEMATSHLLDLATVYDNYQEKNHIFDILSAREFCKSSSNKIDQELLSESTNQVERNLDSFQVTILDLNNKELSSEYHKNQTLQGSQAIEFLEKLADQDQQKFYDMSLKRDSVKLKLSYQDEENNKTNEVETPKFELGSNKFCYGTETAQTTGVEVINNIFSSMIADIYVDNIEYQNVGKVLNSETNPHTLLSNTVAHLSTMKDYFVNNVSNAATNAYKANCFVAKPSSYEDKQLCKAIKGALVDKTHNVIYVPKTNLVNCEGMRNIPLYANLQALKENKQVYDEKMAYIDGVSNQHDTQSIDRKRNPNTLTLKKDY